MPCYSHILFPSSVFLKTSKTKTTKQPPPPKKTPQKKNNNHKKTTTKSPSRCGCLLSYFNIYPLSSSRWFNLPNAVQWYLLLSGWEYVILSIREIVLFLQQGTRDKMQDNVDVSSSQQKMTTWQNKSCLERGSLCRVFFGCDEQKEVLEWCCLTRHFREGDNRALYSTWL